MERGQGIHSVWLSPLKREADLISALTAAFKQDVQVVRIRGFPLPLFAFRHPAHIRQIYQSPSTATRKPVFLLKRVQHLMGEAGFINPGGPDWSQRSTASKDAFSKALSLQMADGLARRFSRMHERWNHYADTETPFDVYREMRLLFFDFGFGEWFSRELDDSQLHELEERTHALVKCFLYRLPAWFPTQEARRFRANARWLFDQLDELIAERQASTDSGHDLLGRLVRSMPEARSDPKALRGELCSLYFGLGNIGCALTWSAYCLASHPSTQSALHEEVDRVSDRGPGNTFNDSDSRLARWVFDEATRLYPPAWAFPRFAPEGTEFSGLRFPRRSILVPVGLFAQRHPDFWDDPNSFRPERFKDRVRTGENYYAHYPFGGGPRACIGRVLATIVGPLVLSVIAQHYELALAERQSATPKLIYGFELAPEHGMWLTVRRRTSQKRRGSGRDSSMPSRGLQGAEARHRDDSPQRCV